MKKIVVIVFAGLLVSAGLQAQKVYIDEDVHGNKRVILDMTVAAGMPADAVTNVSKTARFKELMVGVGAPTTANVLWHPENQEGGTVQLKGEINKRVFEKLEVAPKDLDASGNLTGARILMNWSTAFNGCINSTYDGGNWRLPTQRELMMMWIFNDALKIALPEVGGDALSSSGYLYWIATEYNADIVYAVGFIGSPYGDGFTSNYTARTHGHYVRCVREVTTP